MKVAMGSDHRGAEAIAALRDKLLSDGHEVEVFGANSAEPCDYPEVALDVANRVRDGSADRGMLICGTGIGMCIAANKVDRVRAALVSDELTAQLSRSHNDANVLCLSGDLLGQRLIEKIAQVFLETSFAGGRHARRVAKIGAIERGEDPAGIEIGEPA